MRAMVLIALPLVMVVSAALPAAQQTDTSDAPVDAQFAKAADRYWKILSRRPRRGVAFDQWYRLHLDAGKLEMLSARVDAFATESPDSSNALLLKGMVFERNNKPNDAIASYTAALKVDPTDYYVSAALGSLHARQLDYDKAEISFAEALKHQPPRGELLDLSKRLARIQLRQRKTKAAMQTLAVLAEKFPTDRRTMTELAELLQSEKQFDAAIKQWQAVSKLVGDNPEESIQAELAIATIQAKKGDVSTAVARLNQLLDKVKPDGWIARDLRSRVEDVFLNRNDTAGLIEFCRKRSVTHAAEAESLLHMATVVARFGKQDEAIDAFEKAMEKVPTNKTVHVEFISLLLKATKFDEADVQAQLLATRHNNDIDALRIAGQTYLHRYKDRYAIDDAIKQAQEKAFGAWKGIAEIRPDDASLALQAANACREGAKLKSAIGSMSAPAAQRRRYYQDVPLIQHAEQLYREAIKRAAGNPEYNEFLGEFLFDTGQ
ncbi:tetratricopeptide repeat protein, partial [bacterium]|nr:tetratricopeptide repeat protein [bacterium]